MFLFQRNPVLRLSLPLFKLQDFFILLVNIKESSPAVLIFPRLSSFIYSIFFLASEANQPSNHPPPNDQADEGHTFLISIIQSIRFTRSRIFLSDTARRWRDGIGSGSVNPSKHGELNCFLTIIHFHFQFCYFVIFSIHYNLSISTICNVHSSPTKWKWFAVDGLQ